MYPLPDAYRGRILFAGRKTTMKKRTTAYLTYASLLTALAIILSYFPEIPLAFFAPWLKLDFSFVPMLLLGLSLGPLAGVIALTITNLVHLLGGTTAGVGELANMVVGLSFLLPGMIAYRVRRTHQSALIGMLIGIVLMVIAGMVSNKYLLIPFFFGEQIATFDMSGYLLGAVLPFNLIKGAVVMLITNLLYKRLSDILKKAEKDCDVNDKGRC